MPPYHVYMETKQTSLSYQKRQNMWRKWKRVEIEFSITTQEPVGQVKAMELVIMTELTMIKTAICPTLIAVEVSLQVHVGDRILLMRRIHHQCPAKQSSTIVISGAKTPNPGNWRP